MLKINYDAYSVPNCNVLQGYYKKVSPFLLFGNLQ